MEESDERDESNIKLMIKHLVRGEAQLKKRRGRRAANRELPGEKERLGNRLHDCILSDAVTSTCFSFLPVSQQLASTLSVSPSHSVRVQLN